MASAARPQLDYLHAALEDLKAKHLYTHLRVLDGEQKPVCMVDGKEVINLASNNYLDSRRIPKCDALRLRQPENTVWARVPSAASPGR